MKTITFFILFTGFGFQSMFAQSAALEQQTIPLSSEQQSDCGADLFASRIQLTKFWSPELETKKGMWVNYHYTCIVENIGNQVFKPGDSDYSLYLFEGENKLLEKTALPKIEAGATYKFKHNKRVWVEYENPGQREIPKFDSKIFFRLATSASGNRLNQPDCNMKNNLVFAK